MAVETGEEVRIKSGVEIEEWRNEERTHGDGNFECGVSQQGAAKSIGKPTEDPGAQAESGEVGREHGGGRRSGAAKKERKFSLPDAFVDEGDGARKKEQDADPGANEEGRLGFYGRCFFTHGRHSALKESVWRRLRKAKDEGGEKKNAPLEAEKSARRTRILRERVRPGYRNWRLYRSDCTDNSRPLDI